MAEYAHPELLAETDWLAARLGEPSLRIVDCDEYPAYQRMHLPGAIGLRVHHYLKGEDGVHVMPPEQFESVMAAHGISNDTEVVAYDNSGGLYAARLWWTLDYYGHTRCRVLNGGFRKWWQEGRPLTQEQPHVERAVFRAGPLRDTICRLDDVKAAIEDGSVVIWDVRSPDEYTGRERRQNKRAGHIPGAVNLEWLELTAPPARSGLLLPADEIARKLEAAGITPEKTVYVH
jgi:thiosulfate/3-mercaptopyruvate sulfurtransferase